MKLQNDDISYISARTRLSFDRALHLCEEERDANLVLDAISAEFSKICLTEFSLSYPTYVRLVLFKHSKDKNLDIDEKVYVAKSISIYLNQLKNKVKPELLKQDKPDEKACQYSLVASGLFDSKLAPEYLTKKSFIKLQYGFVDAGRRELGTHVDYWIEVMHRIQKDNWFHGDNVPKLTVKED